ncbi:hypothetical protein L1987_63830 [Smallanthus sonchifolius]|uniref:Uncharacterized protein n=1 Tax=Smallanthus sonchifolius TaxID=185202 RepID=A0ACB9CEA2_9ASTR|nr:hypothetical protein L1987_63830 [Smallanthus sonchifolius]
MTRLLEKDASFVFDEECLKAFDFLKEKLISAPILISPDWSLPFELMCDASDYAVGAVLGQRRDKHFHPIYYASKTLNDAQENCTITEKELLAIVFAFDKFRSYLVLSKTTVFTYHSALQIKDKRGAENVAADHFSRLEDPKREEIREEAIGDKFPHESVEFVAAEKKGMPWFSDLANYLANGVVLKGMTTQQRKKFFRDARRYIWDDPFLFRIGGDRILRRCVTKEEGNEILRHVHEGLTGGHHGPHTTAQKVFDCGFYWPSVVKDALEFVRRCDACQRTGNISSKNEMPQNPIQILEIFDVWGIDFMGPFPISSGNRYILVAIDYVSKWVEAQALPTNDGRVVVRFLKKLFTRFGTPRALISDRGTHFCNAVMEKSVSTLRGHSSFALHDRRLKRVREFRKGDKVLVYNSRLKLFGGKLKSKWSGPYVVKEVFPYRTIELLDEADGNTWKVNGHRLKHYENITVGEQRSTGKRISSADGDMPSEGSSSRPGRKRRGPTPSPRGDTAEQDYNPNLGQRMIKIEALLGDKFRAALCCMAPQYEELTLEFHATFRYKQGNFEQHDAVSFSLGRQVYEMTMPQFAVATQLYTQAEVQTLEFITSVRGVFTKQHDYSLVRNDLVRFWGTISNAPFSGSMLNSEIIDPVYRYIHKILTATLVGRGSGENKINQVDLFCLLCMVEQRPANVASIIAWSMKRTWRGGPDAGVYMGPYVTRIAESLGVFDKYEARYLKDGPVTVMMGVRELQYAGILSMHEPPSWEPIRAGPQGQPPAGSEAAAAMQSEIPTRYQRPLHRSERPAPQYPLQQPRPDPLSLDSMYDRMEHGFRDLHGLMTTGHNEIRTLLSTGQQRQEEALRYMMGNMNMNVPSFFAPQGSSGQQYSGYGQYGSYGQPSRSGQYGADRSPPEFPIFEAESEEDEE